MVIVVTYNDGLVNIQVLHLCDDTGFGKGRETQPYVKISKKRSQLKIHIICLHQEV